MQQVTIIFIFFSLYAAGNDSETIPTQQQKQKPQVKKKATLSCTDPYEFHDKYQDILEGNSIIDLIEADNIIGEGSFGDIYKIKWGEEEAAVKIMNAPTQQRDIITYNLEIELSKKLGQIGVSTEFKDCVEISEVFLMIQEKLFKDLSSKEIVSKFHKMPVLQRLRNYSEIAGKFEKMHKEGYVHQDIKPANIMVKNADISDFRIIDFGMSSKTGGKIVGGSPSFNSPDKTKAIYSRVSRNNNIATVYHDIYALAITFAVMEGSELSIFGQTKLWVDPEFDKVGTKINSYCFRNKMTLECFRALKDNIYQTLKERNNLFFNEIIVDAMENRDTPSMAVFQQKIDELINKIESGNFTYQPQKQTINHIQQFENSEDESEVDFEEKRLI